MMRWLKLGSVGLLAIAFTACDSLGDLDELEVINENNPERDRALSEAGDIESLISSSYYLWYLGSTDYGGPSLMLSTTADEGTLSWGNYAAKDMSSEPRQAYNNSSSYAYAYVNETAWSRYYESLSAVYDGLKALEGDESGALCEDIDCDRVTAFAKFIQGISHGYLALHFDSAFVFDETVDLEAVAAGTEELPLSAYPAVQTAALGYLDEGCQLDTPDRVDPRQRLLGGRLRADMQRVLCAAARTNEPHTGRAGCGELGYRYQPRGRRTPAGHGWTEGSRWGLLDGRRRYRSVGAPDELLRLPEQQQHMGPRRLQDNRVDRPVDRVQQLAGHAGCGPAGVPDECGRCADSPAG